MARPGPGKGWRQTSAVGETQFRAHFPDLVLEQLPQGLQQLQGHDLRQAADVVVGLDGGRRPLEGDAFDDVRIKVPWARYLHPAQFLRCLGKDADEFVADALAFHLRVGDALQQPQKLVGGVHVHQVQVVMLPEQVQDFLGLVFAQQAVVHEDAGEAVADGPVHQDGGDRGVHPAGEGADDPLVAHLSRGWPQWWTR